MRTQPGTTQHATALCHGQTGHQALAGAGRKRGMRGRLTQAIAGAVVLCVSQAAAAQAWPSKPIKMIVPYSAGQGTDIVARYVANEVGKELQQTIVIDNRPGAGGNIGTQQASRSPADGYTIMIGTNATHAANAFLYSKPGFDAQADFEPVAMVGLYPMVYVTHPSNPVKDMQDLQRAARAKPKQLNIAISATTYRMAHELFQQRADVSMFPVDYKGSGQGITAVMAGEVEYMVDSVAALRGAIESQQVKPLGVTTAQPTRLLPTVKPLAQQGVAGYELTGWSVIYAPKGTPADVLRTLSGAFDKVLSKPAVQDQLLRLGIEPKTMARDELLEFGTKERDKWGRLIQGAALKPAS